MTLWVVKLCKYMRLIFQLVVTNVIKRAKISLGRMNGSKLATWASKPEWPRHTPHVATLAYWAVRLPHYRGDHSNWPGSIVITDCWRAYQTLRSCFKYLTVNHSKNFVDLETGTHSNTIEHNWLEIQAAIPKYGSVTWALHRVPGQVSSMYLKLNTQPSTDPQLFHSGPMNTG